MIEIVGLAVTECRGATKDPILLIKNPVHVTVDVSRSGERRVSCPYLQTMQVKATVAEKDINLSVGFCSLFKLIPGLGEKISISTTIEEELLKSVGIPSTAQNREFKIASENKPLCIQKYPS